MELIVILVTFVLANVLLMRVKSYFRARAMILKELGIREWIKSRYCCSPGAPRIWVCLRVTDGEDPGGVCCKTPHASPKRLVVEHCDQRILLTSFDPNIVTGANVVLRMKGLSKLSTVHMSGLDEYVEAVLYKD